MNSKILFVALLITVTASCNNNSSDPEFKYENIGTTKPADTSANKTLITIPNNPTQTAPVQTTTISTNAANNGLNPEHGKPGHRCDIAVGAPLNSKPTTTTATTTTTTAPQQVQTVSTKNTVTAPGMNPPHGEPGHRCDIAVGAPLNSKPTTTTTTTPQQVQTVPTKKTVTTPGMNPPHGEAGHRCDIAVGSPLSQPVKTVSPIVNDSAKK